MAKSEVPEEPQSGSDILSVNDAVAEAREGLSSLTADDLSVKEEPEESSSEGEPEPTEPPPDGEPAEKSEEGEGEELPPVAEHQEGEQQAEGAQEGEDLDHFWNQYRDDDARKKALFENKRYGAEMAKRAREQEARTAELEAELEGLRSTREAASAPSQTETKTEVSQPGKPGARLEETIGLLIESDEQVRNDVGKLAQVREQVGGWEKWRDAKKTEVEKKRLEAQEAQVLFTHYQGLAKESPESEEIQKYLAVLGNKYAQIRSEYTDARMEVLNAESQISILNGMNNQLASRITSRATEYQQREARQVEEKEQHERDVRASQREWDDAFERHCRMHGISDEEEKKDLNEILLRAAYPEADQIADFFDWMQGPDGQKALSVVQRINARARAGYAGQKRKDATQTRSAQTPASQNAPGSEKEDEPSPHESFEDVTHGARKALVGLLTRA